MQPPPASPPAFSSPRPIHAGKLGRWGAWLRRFSARSWFLPAAGGVSAADYFLPILPTLSLLIASTLLQPARWRRVAFWFVAGGVLGGSALAAVVGSWGPEFVARLFGAATQGESWQRLQALIQAHGSWTLFVLAALPWPLRSGVTVCALAGVPGWQIVFALAGGRTVAFGSVAFAVSRSPDWLKRVPFFARIREEVRLIEASCPPPARRAARTDQNARW